MRISIFLLFLLYSCSSEPKSKVELFDKYIWMAMLDYKFKDYESALENFEMAFSTFKDDNSTYYFYAIAAAIKLDNYTKARNLIENAIINTSVSKEYFNSFEEFHKYKNTSDFTAFNAYFEKLYENEKQKEIAPEIKLLDSLINLDQIVRTQRRSLQEIKLVDSINVRKLMKITNLHGWQDKGWIILWHQRTTFKDNNWIWNYFRPRINEEIRKGNLRKSYWAIFEDQNSVITRKQQIYGSYLSNLKDYPIQDIDSVDIRRQRLGLPPLWYLNVVYDSELPEGYTKSETFPFLNKYLKRLK